MPPTAIKHQLTCPIELTSGSFLIGRRGVLVIPRNCLALHNQITQLFIYFRRRGAIAETTDVLKGQYSKG